MALGRPPTDVVIRFWSHITVDVSSGCWLWDKPAKYTGYGRLVLTNRKEKGAHVYSYERMFGPVPKGKELDHLCRNRPCANPFHVEPVTQRENIIRGEGVTARNLRKTHCVNGHPLVGDNLYLRPTGGRRCRECNRRYNAIT